MSASAKNKKISERFREKCRMRMTGTKQNAALVKRRIDAISQLWIVFFPDGEIQEVRNLNAFCKLHNLNPGHMSEVAKGNRPHHKQFKVAKP